MAIPAAAARHAAGFRIDWVCSETVAPLLRLYPWIHAISVDEPQLLRGRLRERIGAVLRLWRALRARSLEAGGYDLIATLYYDRRYRWLSAALRSRRKLSLSRTDRRFMLLPGRHHADEYDRILSGREDGERPAQIAPVPVPQLPPPPISRRSDQQRIVLVPAGARNALRDDALRRWPVGHYVSLARSLAEEGFQVILAGGPEDTWASAHFGDLEAGTAESFADLIGKLSLVETLALFHSAAVTVTHDTGPLHLAGITSTGIVALFGPTDPHGRLPQRDNAIALWGGEHFACRPCYDGRDYAPCRHNGCMDDITPEMVMAQIQLLLHARQEGIVLPPRVIPSSRQELVQLRTGGEP